MDWLGSYESAFHDIPDNTTYFTARGFGFLKYPHQLAVFGGRITDMSLTSGSRENNDRQKYYSQYCLQTQIHSISPEMINFGNQSNQLDDSQISDYNPVH